MDGIFTDYRELVESVARKVKRRNAWAEFDDLVQEGWLGLIDAQGRFDEGKGAAFATFATKRVWGTMQDYLRRQLTGTRACRAERVHDIDLEIIEDETELPSFGPIECTRLHAAIGTLTPIEQRIIACFADGGAVKAGYEQLAQAHGLTGSRISQLKKRAFSKLTTYMEVTLCKDSNC